MLFMCFGRTYRLAVLRRVDFRVADVAELPDADRIRNLLCVV